FHVFYDKKTGNSYSNLPKTFSKILLKNNDLRSRSEFDEKYALPPQVGDIYYKYSEVFLEIRRFRDLIAHQGVSPDYIFASEAPTMVSVDRTPFSRLNIWKDSEITRTKLAPLSKAMAYFTNETLKMFEEFSAVLSNIVELPPPTVPGYKTFIRSDNNKGIINITKLIDQL
ncbi:MAG: hypothetical protein KDD43_01310, partial [Bdellovibrionales bacterium]|nr:hypothetical protein [Bdellovibrionales bacterium]